MSNKEILQANNEILIGNNEEIDAMMTIVEALPYAVAKPESYATNNLMAFDANGNAVDSGLSFSIVDGGLRITHDDG